MIVKNYFVHIGKNQPERVQGYNEGVKKASNAAANGELAFLIVNFVKVNQK